MSLSALTSIRYWIATAIISISSFIGLAVVFTLFNLTPESSGTMFVFLIWVGATLFLIHSVGQAGSQKRPA